MGSTFLTLVVKLKNRKITFWTFWAGCSSDPEQRSVYGSIRTIISVACPHPPASAAGCLALTSRHPRPSSAAYNLAASAPPEPGAWLSFFVHTSRPLGRALPAYCAIGLPQLVSVRTRFWDGYQLSTFSHLSFWPSTSPAAKLAFLSSACL